MLDKAKSDAQVAAEVQKEDEVVDVDDIDVAGDESTAAMAKLSSLSWRSLFGGNVIGSHWKIRLYSMFDFFCKLIVGSALSH